MLFVLEWPCPWFWCKRNLSVLRCYHQLSLPFSYDVNYVYSYIFCMFCLIIIALYFLTAFLQFLQPHRKNIFWNMTHFTSKCSSSGTANKKTRFKYYSSMLCLIINRPSHHTMNIYMQSVPGSHPYARGREVCVFIALNAQISSQTPFRLQPWKTLTKALQAFYLVLHNVTYSTPI